MAKKKEQHVHKYERRKLGAWKADGGHDIYKCAISGCTHYLVDLELLIGRQSLCWGKDGDKNCPNAVEMTRYLVFKERRKWPLCGICKAKRKEEKPEPTVLEGAALEDLRSKILSEIGEEELDANTLDS